MLLSLIGAVLGLLLAQWATPALLAVSGAQFQSFVKVSAGADVVAAILGIALLCGAVFGLVPVWITFQADLAHSLTRQGQQPMKGFGRQRFQNGVIVAQVALALFLTVCAGLMARGFREATSQDLGFRSDNLLTFRVDMRGAKYAEDEPVVRLVREYLDRLAAVPGVERVEMSNPTIPTDDWTGAYILYEDHRSDAPDGTYPQIMHAVSPGYFDLLGIPVVQGQVFTEQDTEPIGAVVSNLLADEHWPGQNPLGKRLKNGARPDSPWLAIIGVVADVRYEGFLADEQPAGDIYLPLRQLPWRPLTMSFLVQPKAAASPHGLESALRQEMKILAPDLPIYDVATLEERLSEQTAKARFQIVLISLFSLLALVLASIGIYGVVAYSTSQRTREIAVRMSLGADRAKVVRMVVGRGAALAAIGLALGLIAGLPGEPPAREPAARRQRHRPADPGRRRPGAVPGDARRQLLPGPPGRRHPRAGDGTPRRLIGDETNGYAQDEGTPAVAAVVILALSFGALGAALIVSKAVLWDPLPFAEPSRLVEMSGTFQEGGEVQPWAIGHLDVLDWRRQNQVFESMSVFTDKGGIAFNLLTPKGLERLDGELVSSTYLQTLGIEPAVGRFFTAEEDGQPFVHPVTVLSYELWQRQFGGDPSIVGRKVNLSGKDWQVVGVGPQGFRGVTDTAQLWIPSSMVPAPEYLEVRRFRWLNVVARLKEGVTPQQAQADLDRITAALAQQYPDQNRGIGVEIQPLRQFVFDASLAEGLRVVLVGAAAALLLALIDAAGLLLVGTAGGPVPTGRTVGVCFLAALGGLGLAAWATRGLLPTSGFTFPSFAHLSPDLALAGGLLALAVICGWGISLLGRMGRTGRVVLIVAAVVQVILAVGSAGEGRNDGPGVPPTRRVRTWGTGQRVCSRCVST